MTTETIEVPDRRAVLEAAFDAAESAEKPDTSADVKTTPEEPKGADVATNTEGPDVTAPTKTEATDDADGSKSLQSKPEEEATEKLVNVDKAPQAWKAAQKAKWDKLDPDIRQEVLRRERETTQVLNETAQARQFSQQFSQIVQPYMARIQALNSNPVNAVQELFKADYTLSTAPPMQRAQFMAKLIKDYEIDIRALDNALAGTPGVDPVSSQVEQLLAQRLAPLNQFLTQQQQAEQARQAEADAKLASTVESMSTDNVKYPYFEQVRESMADIVEIMAKRGQQITIEAAYNRAVAMDPVISQEVAEKTAAEAAVARVASLDKKAQQALKASVSVGGAPSGARTGTPNANDRRATIAAAFEEWEGR